MQTFIYNVNDHWLNITLLSNKSQPITVITFFKKTPIIKSL